ncbi:hypothetical protein PybrP1_001706 [[Pythium] brassicae (nom. inval.)]|nr:hypothetical protein PybrP1_001706 [[Pythium] brassicae (nom. inval.)]
MTQHQPQPAAWPPPTLFTASSAGAFALAPLSPPATAVAAAKSASPAGDSEQRLARRRKQCRVSQRRYRDKKGSAEYNLRLDVNGLRETVERLRQTRQLLESRLWSDRMSLVGPIRKAVEQYYVMFSQGLHNADAGGYERDCFDVQVGFLHAFMDVDVMFGESKGVLNVLEQWRRYSAFHDTMWVKTVSAEILGPRESPIAVVQGLLGVRLSRTTIETLFPHILQNEALVQALIGKEVVYDTSTTYTFNDRNQVLRQDLVVDFLSGLTKLLNSTAATSRVLEQALITSSSKIGDVDEERLALLISRNAQLADNSAGEPEPESPFEVLDDDDDDYDEDVGDERVSYVGEDCGSPTHVADSFADSKPSTQASCGAKRGVSRLDLAYIMS